MSTFLVAMQFGLLVFQALLAVSGVLQGTFTVAAWMLAGASFALAVWTLCHNRPGNFNIRPIPKASGTLVTTGPYRWIRHPMYTSLLLGAAALVCVSDLLIGGLNWLALVIVLLLKANIEERWMQEKHTGYTVYMRQSKRFLPWLF
jgi:protein-S-isoprenylcysteine O-methyltransferase Ste14